MRLFKVVAVIAALMLGSVACGNSVSFKSCDEARAAGVTPLHKGDPGYSRKLDRDGDGIACDN